jgi:DNA-binding CsgD family transcriptional regulator
MDSQARLKSILLVILLLVACVTAIDLITDYSSGTPISHFLVEAIVLMLSILAFALLRRDALGVAGENQQLRADLENVRQASVEWQQKLAVFSSGVAEAIQAQFVQWHFSQAESEVAKLLLRGFGLKEIATLRGTSEKTAQHQATSVYRKSGLGGRAELSAYFLENLLGASHAAPAGADFKPDK